MSTTSRFSSLTDVKSERDTTRSLLPEGYASMRSLKPYKVHNCINRS
ncbi:MAG: hypothetical protein RMY28_016875 [Nostoc sp. ChiSLP01]